MQKLFVIVRAISAALCWSLFFFWWKKVLRSTGQNQRVVLYSLLVVAITLIFAAIYSSLWIFHNKRVARRGSRGLVSFYRSPLFERDAIGREILSLPEPERNDRVIIVNPKENTKEFSVETQGAGAAR
jgi:hypothetical protein